jgi:hypothetical protein
LRLPTSIQVEVEADRRRDRRRATQATLIPREVVADRG